MYRPIILLAISALALAQSNPRLKVTVFYEALCPDSVKFFANQVRLAYPIVGDKISMEFVPYGKADHFVRDGRWAFRCHHGANECYANQLQACALHQAVHETSKVNFLVCMMSSTWRDIVSPQHVEKCAAQNAISAAEIFDCMRGDLKDTLLVRHGERTRRQDPLITFVPTVVFDDAYDPHVQTDALYDLLGAVCDKLLPRPSSCPAKQRLSWFSF